MRRPGGRRSRLLVVAVALASAPVSAGADETRDRALQALEKRVREPDRLQHAAAVEAIMRAYARAGGDDPDEWGLAGLLHDIDRSETDAHPTQHGIVGARLLAELGFSPAVVHAVESHDDAAGVPRALPIDHALHCADQIYWAILASGLRPEPEDSSAATPADVYEGLRRAGQPDRIGRNLRAECSAIGQSMDEVLRLSLGAMASAPPAPWAP